MLLLCLWAAQRRCELLHLRSRSLGVRHRARSVRRLCLWTERAGSLCTGGILDGVEGFLDREVSVGWARSSVTSRVSHRVERVACRSWTRLKVFHCSSCVGEVGCETRFVRLSAFESGSGACAHRGWVCEMFGSENEIGRVKQTFVAVCCRGISPRHPCLLERNLEKREDVENGHRMRK
jgi:hypothetical protein